MGLAQWTEGTMRGTMMRPVMHRSDTAVRRVDYKVQYIPGPGVPVRIFSQEEARIAERIMVGMYGRRQFEICWIRRRWGDD